MKKHTISLNRATINLLFLFFLINISVSSLFSQKAENPIDKNQQNTSAIKGYPDKFSDLDENKPNPVINEETITNTIDKARQMYLQALMYIEKADTTNASKQFINSIETLNTLVKIPNINNNSSFTDLAHSIIDDYESYIKRLDNLGDNSAFFVIRDMLLKEVDKIRIQTPTRQFIVTNDSTAKKSVYPENEPHQLSIPLTDNEFVEKSLLFLTQNKGRKYYTKWLERSTKWFPMFKKVAEKEKVPQEIVYLSMIESGLNPTAVSKSKAVGLWQFIRSTGELYKLNSKASFWIDERRDPEKATSAAMRHLRDLYDELGDWHLALAAYNCGINGVNRAIKRSKLEKPSYWDIREFLPKETRNYVPLYIAAAKIGMQPSAYGFDVNQMTFLPEYKYESVEIHEPVSLKALAQCVNLTNEELNELNPELIKSCTPPDVKSYKLKIPVGKSQLFNANFSQLTDEQKKPWVVHKVEKKETLKSIAADYGISIREIMEVNDIASYKAKLKRGAILQIPIEKSENKPLDNIADNKVISNTETETNTNNNTFNSPIKAKKADIENSEKPKEQKKVTNTPKEQKPKTVSSGKKEYILHTIKEGETLYSICLAYGIQLEELRTANNSLLNNDIIKKGNKLRIPVNHNLSLSNNDDNNTKDVENNAKTKKIVTIKHKVKKGETLAQLAEKYDVTTESIKNSNKIKKNKLVAGATLKIKTTQHLAASKTESKSNHHDKPIIHKVAKGETLNSIATKYNVDEEDLKKWNPDEIQGNTVFKGSRLSINQASKQANTYTKNKSIEKETKNAKNTKYYSVRSGDTLGSIAKRFGISVNTLKSKNKNIKETQLQIGQKLRIN